MAAALSARRKADRVCKGGGCGGVKKKGKKQRTEGVLCGVAKQWERVETGKAPSVFGENLPGRWIAKVGKTSPKRPTQRNHRVSSRPCLRSRRCMQASLLCPQSPLSERVTPGETAGKLAGTLRRPQFLFTVPGDSVPGSGIKNIFLALPLPRFSS